jgi:hypothetical protein
LLLPSSLEVGWTSPSVKNNKALAAEFEVLGSSFERWTCAWWGKRVTRQAASIRCCRTIGAVWHHRREFSFGRGFARFPSFHLADTESSLKNKSRGLIYIQLDVQTPNPPFRT